MIIFRSMKFLKALLNSLICGLFFCCLLALLFADLNINSKLDLFFLGRLALILFITYGLIAAALGLVIFSIYTFFSARKNIAFISPTFLSLGFSFLTSLFLIIFWNNVKYFSSFFGTETRLLIKNQMIVLLILTALGPLVCYIYYKHGKRVLAFVAYFLIAAGLVGSAFYRRPETTLPRPTGKLLSLEARGSGKKVTIIELEGLSLDFIIPLISEDKLPNFSLLVEQGSWGRLESFTPSDTFILDATFGTGKRPAKHRQISPMTYHVGSLKQELEIIPRFLFFKQLTRTGLLTAEASRPAYRPKDLWRIVTECGLSLIHRDQPDAVDASKVTAKTDTLFTLFYKDLERDLNPAVRQARQAFIRDSQYEDEAFQERAGLSPQVFGLRLNGLNLVEKYFYRYSFPEVFGNLLPEEVAKYGSVIERYYRFYDQVIGKYLAGLKEDELLIVFSSHGIEPLPFGKRVVDWVMGETDVSAFHEMGPEGVVFFYGQTINREKNIEGMRLFDLAPSILYYLGLPVSKDMDGIVLSSLFRRDFTGDNPILSISSYEDYAVSPGRQAP